MKFKAKSQERGRGSWRGAASPSPLAKRSGGVLQAPLPGYTFWTYAKSLENASNGRKCQMQFNFFIEHWRSRGTIGTNDTTGGTPRFRRTPVEKHLS